MKLFIEREKTHHLFFKNTVKLNHLWYMFQKMIYPLHITAIENFAYKSLDFSSSSFINSQENVALVNSLSRFIVSISPKAKNFDVVRIVIFLCYVMADELEVVNTVLFLMDNVISPEKEFSYFLKNMYIFILSEDLVVDYFMFFLANLKYYQYDEIFTRILVEEMKIKGFDNVARLSGFVIENRIFHKANCEINSVDEGEGLMFLEASLENFKME